MRHLTGPAKWLRLARAALTRPTLEVPLGFALFLLKTMRHQKLTMIDGRTYADSLYPPLESPAYACALENLGRLSRGERRLMTLCISVTLRCPMQCSYCCAKNAAPGAELSTSRLTGLVREAVELGAYCIHFSGGEPLLRDDLPDIVAAVDDRAVSMLLTSGLNFPRMSRRLQQAGLDIVSVSLDTFDEHAYNRRRGHPNAFGIAVDAVEAALARGFYTVLGLTPDETILEPDAFDRYVRAAGRLGVHEIRICTPRPCVTLGRERSPVLTRAQVDTFRRFQIRYNGMADLPAVTSIDYQEYPRNQGYRGGTVYAHVNANGELAPCTLSPISFGNVASRPLAEVYENMRRHIPYPFARCPIRKTYQLIRDVPSDQLPVRDPATVAQICEALNTPPRPLPAFWHKLGLRRDA